MCARSAWAGCFHGGEFCMPAIETAAPPAPWLPEWLAPINWLGRGKSASHSTLRFPSLLARNILRADFRKKRSWSSPTLSIQLLLLAAVGVDTRCMLDGLVRRREFPRCWRHGRVQTAQSLLRLWAKDRSRKW